MSPLSEQIPALNFGPFRLAPIERLLTKDGTPVELGGRAMDILLCLLSQPSEIFSKKDLIAAAWPDVVVEEGSLRFQMAGLRKALGDNVDGARYIATLAGRGYCFVAPVARSPDGPADQIAPPVPGSNLPNRPSRLIGRAADIDGVLAGFRISRLVTVVGSGGVGKTSVAVAVAHDMAKAEAGAVIFVDLGLVSDPRMVATSLTAMLGVSVMSANPVPSLIAFLRDKRMLLVLDTCEHVIDDVAALVTEILRAAPQVRILTTSREALKVEEEQVYRLTPLAVAPAVADLTATVAVTYPAIQLFVERAAANGGRSELADADAPIVAGICERLDGVALAIELAAGRVEAFGLRQVAALLDERLLLTWQGHRNAPIRQRTLHATIDWSFRLLSAMEQAVLRRLSVFVGPFTMDAAVHVVPGSGIDQEALLGAIDGLVAKSMVAVRPIGATMRYRLLDTTRAYLLDIGADAVEHRALCERHAAYQQQWLVQIARDWPSQLDPATRLLHLGGLNNARAALEWCFGEGGDRTLGVSLAAAAAPIFLRMCLLPECRIWSERAIVALDDAARGGADEMHLQASLGQALMLKHGNSEDALEAATRSLAIAEDRDDAANQLQILGLLHTFRYRQGRFSAAMACAERAVAVAGRIDRPEATAFARSLHGISLHIGELRGARVELEAALRRKPPPSALATVHLGYDYHLWAGAALARTLWLDGYPDQAETRMKIAVSEAAAMNHPVNLAIVLLRAVSVYLWTGDHDAAKEHQDWVAAHAESHSLAPYLAAARGYRAELLIRRGDFSQGMEILRRSLDDLQAIGFGLVSTPFNMALAEGHVATGSPETAVLICNETNGRVTANGDVSYVPELLRVKAGAVLALGGRDHGEELLVSSLGLSRRMAARGWELRAAMDLAALWSASGRSDEARTLLQPVLGAFTEGRDTADVKAASALLAALH